MGSWHRNSIWLVNLFTLWLRGMGRIFLSIIIQVTSTNASLLTYLTSSSGGSSNSKASPLRPSSTSRGGQVSLKLLVGFYNKVVVGAVDREFEYCRERPEVST